MKDEKKSTNETQPYFQKTAAVAVPTKGLKQKKVLTLEANSISKVKELLCQTTSELRDEIMPSKYHELGRAPATCVDVIDLIHGEEFMLVCNAVLASSFRRAGEPLTGRYFAIQCGEVDAGKRYRRVNVVELERVE